MATNPRVYQVDQLNERVNIVGADGKPTPQFIQQWNLLLALAKQTAILSGLDIETTAPIEGGGTLLDLAPISHADSGVTPGTYASATVTVSCERNWSLGTVSSTRLTFAA